jgi:hypothetical protein
MLVNDEYEQFVPPTIKTVELPDWAAETTHHFADAVPAVLPKSIGIASNGSQ